MLTRLERVEDIICIKMFNKSINTYLCGTFCCKQKKDKSLQNDNAQIIISRIIDIDKVALTSENLFTLDNNKDKFIKDELTSVYFTIQKDCELFNMLDKLDKLLCQKINVEHCGKFVNYPKKLTYKMIDTSNDSIFIPLKCYDNKYQWFIEKNEQQITGTLDDLKLQTNSAKTINFAIKVLFCVNEKTNICWLSLKILQMLFQ